MSGNRLLECRDYQFLRAIGSRLCFEKLEVAAVTRQTAGQRRPSALTMGLQRQEGGKR